MEGQLSLDTSFIIRIWNCHFVFYNRTTRIFIAMARPSTAYLHGHFSIHQKLIRVFLYLLNMADFKVYKILRDELLWWIANVVSITARRTFETFDKHRQSVHGVVSIHVLILSLGVLCLYDALFVSLADYGQERIILSCYGTNYFQYSSKELMDRKHIRGH